MIKEFADWTTYSLFGLKETHLADSVNYFIYDSIKVVLLLLLVTFFVGIIRTYLTPNKIKNFLSKRKQGFGNLMAAVLGIPVPFCSCSAVPIFLGIMESGVPLGIAFSFLIAAPLINEVAVALLFALFGFKIASLYIVSGLIIATVAGLIIGKLKMNKYVEKFSKHKLADKKYTFKERISFSYHHSLHITKKVLLFVLLGIAVGSLIHGYAPENLLSSIAGKDNWFAVPLAVLIGIPLYSNAAGILPIVNALIAKGVAMGTALAFMMAVIGLSFPEFIILRKIMKPKLLAAFIIVMFIAITLTGYLFNWVI